MCEREDGGSQRKERETERGREMGLSRHFVTRWGSLGEQREDTLICE